MTKAEREQTMLCAFMRAKLLLIRMLAITFFITFINTATPQPPLNPSPNPDISRLQYTHLSPQAVSPSDILNLVSPLPSLQTLSSPSFQTMDIITPLDMKGAWSVII